MTPKYALAREFASQKGFTLPSNRLVLRLIDAAFRWQRRGFHWSDEVSVRTHRVKGGLRGSARLHRRERRRTTTLRRTVGSRRRSCLAR